jgi:hypothetical protein
LPAAFRQLGARGQIAIGGCLKSRPVSLQSRRCLGQEVDAQGEARVWRLQKRGIEMSKPIALKSACRPVTVAAAGLLFLLGFSLAQAQTIGYGDAMRALANACGSDIETYCQGEVPGEGLQKCFERNAATIAPTCTAAYSSTMAVLAQREADQANAILVCEADAKRLCSDYRVGRGAMLTCLVRVDIRPKVSRKCDQAITTAGWR